MNNDNTANTAMESYFVMDTNLNIYLLDESIDFPFRTSLSFEKLIEHITKFSESDDKFKSGVASSILDELNSAPELQKPIYDMAIVEKYKSLISNMMTFVFPSAFWEMQTYAASTPYMNEIFYSSPKFAATFKFEKGTIKADLNIDKASFNFGKAIGAYIQILSHFYGLDLKFDFPLVYMIMDPETGLDRYFKLNLAAEFVDIKLKGKLKKLSEQDLANIKAKIYDLEFMRKMIEPENFEFSGFLVMNAINISDSEILSAIKKDLIESEKDSISIHNRFLRLQHNLKSLLKCPGLFLGLSEVPQDENSRTFKHGKGIGNSFLRKKESEGSAVSIKGSIYEDAIVNKKAVIINDLLEYQFKTKIENDILESGIRNLFIAPLIIDNTIAGILELGSPQPGKLNLINTLRLREVLPLIALAVERSSEEMNNKISAIIKEKCTAIHPSLEWKFRKAAVNYLQNSGSCRCAEMEEIVFNEVYPLYGLSDIRNSSIQRNDAIRQDLTDNLLLAVEVIDSANNHKRMKALDEVRYRLDKKINSLRFGLNSGEEAEIVKFLSRKIVPLFGHLRNYNQEVKSAIEKYESSLDPKLGIIYRQRRDYEDSATKINDMIATYLDEEQENIQEIYPHYFERYKTDGVDHNLYVGSSLVENMEFDRIYLRNIRLWQLMVMCGIARRSVELRKELSIPLETAHLVLVQDAPLSVKFRYDEKKFDVDGAYNVRYEIMKKRIDKASIKGKEERLTQPDKIAIVYSQSSEEQEYIEYIEYLQSQKYLKEELEQFELEDFQGLTGLKALRVAVQTDNPDVGRKLDSVILRKTVKQCIS